MPDLQTLANSIPLAADGGVITSEYHNSLRDTVKAITDQLQGAGTASTLTFTFAPDLSPVEPSPAWLRQLGIVVKPVAATSAIGWMGLQLPNGYRIDHMVISGIKLGTIGSWTVALIRQELSSSASLAIIGATLEDA